MPLVKLTIVLCLGIIIGNSIHIPQSGIQFLFACIIGLIGIGALSTNRHFSSLLIYIITLLIGVSTYSMHTLALDYDHYSKIENNEILIAQIESKKLNSKNIQSIINVKYAGNNLNQLQECGGHLLIYFPLIDQESIKEGSMVILKNNGYKIFENPNPLTFDYENFLSRKKIYAQSFAAAGEYVTIDSKQANIFKRISQISKEHIKSLINQYVSTDENKSIANAMLLGDRSLVSDELNKSYSNTGAIHVLAVSGLHVGIVGMIIIGMLRPLRRFRHSDNIVFPLALCSIWLYVYMTGCGPPSLRAGLMYSTLLAAPLCQKYSNVYNTISAAAMAILLWNPHQLFTVSFQFSFIAVISIIFFFPYLDRQFLCSSKLIKRAYQFIILSISAQILLTPLSIYYFHKMPLFFWLSGMIAVPAAFLILMTSVIMVFSSLIPVVNSVVTPIIGDLLDMLIGVLNWSINRINEIPHLIIDKVWIDDIGLFVCYTGLGLFMIGLKYKRAKILYLSIAILIAYGIHHNVMKSQKQEESTIIAYYIHKNSIIEYINGGHHTYLHHDIDKASTEDWNCRNFRTYNMVQSKVTPKEMGVEQMLGLHLIEDKLILINPDKELLSYQLTKPIDLFIINNNDLKLNKSIIENYKIKQIVIDGAVYKSKKYLKEYLQEKDIAFHDTKESAFTYRLN